MLLLAQLTDTHLFADSQKTMFGCLTNQTFAAVMQEIRQLAPSPDLLLLTGDISQDETAASYQYARSLIVPLGIPTYWLPGNHDQNPATITQLNGDCILGTKSFVQSGWRFILLDSAIVGQPAGCLAVSQLSWLATELQDARPTLVAIHHHPIACGLTDMDQIGLTNAHDLFAVLDRYNQVKLVICGHIHQEFSTQRGHIQYFGTPSTCIQLKPRQATLELDAQPPGFRLFRLYPDGRFETEVRRLATVP
ncbi:3',5'-cyclic-AMP phosphodiesterase [filamentous cyanobacterium LEGE 11480]|uniref:3',5'-cyclic-AMP phosphodiesterase n=1 Tax=Romeriopsis navalis LEGE 11480 TaxID=2777977 RepID=A0A928Z584_9CYAN|nr:3',5'-cyclic-AMP phosphodiesterase [Romeriopsis navalis]MBE9031203.1 3',5'-cyclic-AMP phosphodiesterase [Romeriopsis navalis LEGE 11480]